MFMLRKTYFVFILMLLFFPLINSVDSFELNHVYPTENDFISYLQPTIFLTINLSSGESVDLVLVDQFNNELINETISVNSTLYSIYFMATNYSIIYSYHINVTSSVYGISLYDESFTIYEISQTSSFVVFIMLVGFVLILAFGFLIWKVIKDNKLFPDSENKGIFEDGQQKKKN